jgi:hypothetical protein
VWRLGAMGEPLCECARLWGAGTSGADSYDTPGTSSWKAQHSEDMQSVATTTDTTSRSPAKPQPQSAKSSQPSSQNPIQHFPPQLKSSPKTSPHYAPQGSPSAKQNT